MKDFKVKAHVAANVEITVKASHPAMAIKTLAEEFSKKNFDIILDQDDVDFIALEVSDKNYCKNNAKVSTFLTKSNDFNMDDISFSHENIPPLDTKGYIQDDGSFIFYKDDEEYDEEDLDCKYCENCPYIEECQRKEQLE